MFKVGDIIITKDRTAPVARYIYKVEEIYLDHMNIIPHNAKSGTGALGFYVPQEAWMYEKIYSRRLKLEQLKEKING